MWVDTTSIHSDNPGWRDMVCSYFHEWLTTFMIAVSKTCLALVLQKTYPLKPGPPRGSTVRGTGGRAGQRPSPGGPWTGGRGYAPGGAGATLVAGRPPVSA